MTISSATKLKWESQNTFISFCLSLSLSHILIQNTWKPVCPSSLQLSQLQNQFSHYMSNTRKVSLLSTLWAPFNPNSILMFSAKQTISSVCACTVTQSAEISSCTVTKLASRRFLSRGRKINDVQIPEMGTRTQKPRQPSKP